MYEGFYKLKENPFRLTPDPGFMCMTAQHQEALAGLVYGACTRPGLTVLTGEAGTGKTTLLYALIELLEKRNSVTAMCTNPMLSAQEFYDLLTLKFGAPCDSLLKSRQLEALEQHFRRHHEEGRPCLLVIDEAQRLPVELLEEVRLLLNLETTRQKLLQIILAGQPELMETLSRYDLRQLKQRVSSICSLRPLSRDELREYLLHRLAQAGREDPGLFPDACMDLIYEYSQGIPRLVNTLSEAALEVGFGLGAHYVTPAIIEEAARDLALVSPAAQPSAASIAAVGGSGSLNGSPSMAHRSEPGSGKGAGRGPVGSSAASAAAPEPRIPLQSYSERQKILGFFGHLIQHWR